MFRREIIMVASLAGAVFLLVTLAALEVGRAMQKSAFMMALDDVPSLVNAGAAIFHIQENWLAVNQLPDLRSASERLSAIQKIQANSPEQLWLNYREAIFTPEEQRTYNQMMLARSNYLTLREGFFADIQAGRLAQARVMLKTTLVPNYERYKLAATKLFECDTKIGLARASQAVWFSRAFLFLFVIFGLILFATGFLAGLRLALNGISPRWRSRRNES